MQRHQRTEPAIAALQATPGQATTSPWGPDDQIGMLNLVTPESISRILTEVDAHKLFDLSVDYFQGMPGWTGWAIHRSRSG